jgi:nucleoside-diphosphate-sugar epimerase
MEMKSGKSKTISILGCGWLGLPLAKHLIEAGYRVKGSTTAKKNLAPFSEQGIEPFYLVLDPELRGDGVDDFLSSDILVVNFPPERRDDIVEYHQAQINALLSDIKKSPVKKVIFVSSTSVYPNLGRDVFEDEETPPTKASGRALLAVEKLFRACPGFETTILRFGGLIGYDREPGSFLSGRKEVRNGDAPVNLIHRDDCIAIIRSIIENNVWGEIFNACADLHPYRKDYYISQAKKIGVEPPAFTDGVDPDFKIVRSGKLKRLLSYEFKYPDPSTIE